MKTQRALIILLSLITLVTLFYTWTNWKGARHLESARTELTDKKESIQLEELLPPPLPDNCNVATTPLFKSFLNSETNSSLGTLKMPPPQCGERNTGESSVHHVARQIDKSFSGDNLAAGQLILLTLSPHDQVLSELKISLQTGKVTWPLDWNEGPTMKVPYMSFLMKSSRVLRALALAEIASGSPDKGLENLRTLLTLGDLSDQPPLYIGILVKSACLQLACDVVEQGLRRGAWNDAQLEAITRRLSTIHLTQDFKETLRLERAAALRIDLYNLDPKLFKIVDENAANEQEGFSSRIMETLLPIAWKLRPSGWTSEDRALYIELMQNYIEAIPVTGGLSNAEILHASSKTRDMNVLTGFISPLMNFIPAITGTFKKVYFTQTLLNSVITACAVERYRLEKKCLPSTLEQLTPDFLPSVPEDPMTGKPLLYKSSSTGSFSLYGTGWNRQDDGALLMNSPASPSEKQADWGIMITHPTH